jgi:hypothetical protein
LPDDIDDVVPETIVTLIGTGDEQNTDRLTVVIERDRAAPLSARHVSLP